jgi:Phosphate-selective porin O and P
MHNSCGRIISLLFISLFFLSAPTSAQKTKISGYVFGDYFYIAKSHRTDLEGRSGLTFRRIYLTMDSEIAEGWSSRLRMEMNGAGDFKTAAKMVPTIKDAYLQYKTGKHKIYFGISSSPTWNLFESKWGYRSVEKTPLDLYKYGSSRDIGIAAKGPLDSEGRVKYHVMLGNGAGNKSESNNGKKAMLSLTFKLMDALELEVNTDYEERDGEKDRYTVQGALYYKLKEGNVGVLFARQNRETGDVTSEDLDIFSVFAAHKVSEKAKVFARYDRQFQTNSSAAKIAYLPFSPDAEASLVILGVDFAPAKNIHFMPNVETVLYKDNGVDTPDNQILPRMTLYYKF